MPESAFARVKMTLTVGQLFGSSLKTQMTAAEETTLSFSLALFSDFLISDFGVRANKVIAVLVVVVSCRHRTELIEEKFHSWENL